MKKTNSPLQLCSMLSVDSIPPVEVIHLTDTSDSLEQDGIQEREQKLRRRLWKNYSVKFPERAARLKPFSGRYLERLFQTIVIQARTNSIKTMACWSKHNQRWSWILKKARYHPLVVHRLLKDWETFWNPKIAHSKVSVKEIKEITARAYILWKDLIKFEHEFTFLLNISLEFAAGNWRLRAKRTLAKIKLCETLGDACLWIKQLSTSWIESFWCFASPRRPASSPCKTLVQLGPG